MRLWSVTDIDPNPQGLDWRNQPIKAAIGLRDGLSRGVLKPAATRRRGAAAEMHTTGRSRTRIYVILLQP
jgi:hypothetical protein